LIVSECNHWLAIGGPAKSIQIVVASLLAVFFITLFRKTDRERKPDQLDELRQRPCAGPVVAGRQMRIGYAGRRCGASMEYGFVWRTVSLPVQRSSLHPQHVRHRYHRNRTQKQHPEVLQTSCRKCLDVSDRPKGQGPKPGCSERTSGLFVLPVQVQRLGHAVKASVSADEQ